MEEDLNEIEIQDEIETTAPMELSQIEGASQAKEPVPSSFVSLEHIDVPSFNGSVLLTQNGIYLMIFQSAIYFFHKLAIYL